MGALHAATGSAGRSENQAVIQSVATGERRVLIEDARDARYVSTGHLVYVVDDDLLRRTVRCGCSCNFGSSGCVGGGCRTRRRPRVHCLLLQCGDERVTGLPPGFLGTRRAVWVDLDRSHRSDRAAHSRAAPVSQRAGCTERDARGRRHCQRERLGHLDLRSGTRHDDPAHVRRGSGQPPALDAGGSRVVFWSERNGGGLFWKAADGTGDAELLLQRDAALRPYAWSTDGRLVVEADQLSPASPGPDGQLDSTGIAILNIEGERVLESILDTEFNEREPAVSLDGRWLAYNSNESGTQAAYVRPFPDVDAGKWQVSAGSAFDPGWSPDGRELFYRSPGTE